MEATKVSAAHMGPRDARQWLVKSSLLLTSACLVFFLLAPVLGYPLEFGQAFRLLEILLPVFLGYLGSATQFLFGDEPALEHVKESPSELLGLLVRGPIAVFLVAIVSALVAFGITNGATASPGAGMSLDNLALALSLSIGLLAVTTNVIVSYLFSTKMKKAIPTMADARKETEAGTM